MEGRPVPGATIAVRGLFKGNALPWATELRPKRRSDGATIAISAVGYTSTEIGDPQWPAIRKKGKTGDVSPRDDGSWVIRLVKSDIKS